MSSNDLSALIRDVDGVIAGGEYYSGKIISCPNKLKIIARAGVGYDKVDLETATKMGIYVTITPIQSKNSAMQ
jgi:lactate dehydrogenase-like 2-hydroxyacid dehydrogenase